MAKRQVVLRGAGGSLHLEAGADAWCKVVLELEGGNCVRLGADSLPLICARLRGALGDRLNPTKGEIDGAAVSWVTSLFEAHATLYVAETAAGRRFLVQGAEGDLLGSIGVGHDQLGEWLAALGE